MRANRLKKADKEVKRQIDLLMKVYTNEIGNIIERHAQKVITNIGMQLIHMEPITLPKLMASNAYHSMQVETWRDLHTCAREVEQYWFLKRRYIELLSRLGMGYLEKKVRPPWAKVKLDLGKAVVTDDRFDPRTGHLLKYFSMMSKSIVNQVEMGAMRGESASRIITRLKNMFNRKTKKGVRESKFNADDPDFGYIQYGPTDELDLHGEVNMQFGFFTPDDIAVLNEEMIAANGYNWRQYRPWFSEELLANNRQLYAMDQMLWSDAINLVSSGQLDGAKKLKGIASFVWQVQRPGVCDCCDARDGLTMEEIKSEIKDQYGAKPPSLHPNCRCSLVPQMDEKFKEPSLEEEGVEWDPESGDLTIPAAVKDKYKLDMSLAEYIQYLKNGGGNE